MQVTPEEALQALEEHAQLSPGLASHVATGRVGWREVKSFLTAYPPIQPPEAGEAPEEEAAEGGVWEGDGGVGDEDCVELASSGTPCLETLQPAEYDSRKAANIASIQARKAATGGVPPHRASSLTRKLYLEESKPLDEWRKSKAAGRPELQTQAVVVEESGPPGAGEVLLNTGLESDLSRVERGFATSRVMKGVGTKLLIFGKDALYVAAPHDFGRTIRAAEGFGNAIGAASTGGHIATVTSCGIAPSTGNVWAVMPQLSVVSDQEWGQSTACFPLSRASGGGSRLGVVNDGKLLSVDLQSGLVSPVQGVPGKCEGDIERATATPDGDIIFFTTSTSMFGGGGELWRIQNGIAELLDSSLEWGWSTFVMLHRGGLYTFMKKGVAVTPGALENRCGASRQCDEREPICVAEGCHAAASDGTFIYAVKPNLLTADELWCIEAASEGMSSAAKQISYHGPEPRSVGGMVAVPELHFLPGSDWLSQFTEAGRLTAETASEIFDRYDHDGNGVMDSLEMEHLWMDTMQSIHLPWHMPAAHMQSLRQEMVAQAVLRSRVAFDADGNGLVEKEEFVEYVGHMQHGLQAWLRNTNGDAAALL